jgi:acyl carrier protein
LNLNPKFKPNNRIEDALQAIWCNVLKLEPIGINDDFFDLGGNSLSVMSMIAQYKLPMIAAK